MSRRRLAAAIAAVVAAVSMTAGGRAAGTFPTPVDHTAGVNVNPPGENGHIPIADFLTHTGASYNEGTPGNGYPAAHFTDQIDDYWQIDPATRSFPGYKSSHFYDPIHPGPRDTAEDVGRGAVIYRDAHRGIPRIFAAEEDGLFYGAGVAAAEDRLGQMQLFRRAGLGRLAEILGAGYAQYDYQRRLDGYSTADWVANVATLTSEQQRLLADYSDGVNAVIQRDIADGSAPAELVALGDWPPHTAQPDDPHALWWWRPQDTFAIISLMVQAFGDEGGHELEHLALRCSLEQRWGTALGDSIFLDRLWTRDGLAPPSVPGNTALPPQQWSMPAPQTSIDGCAANGQAVHAAAVEAALRQLSQAVTRRLNLPRWGSNAIAVAPSKSASGNTILYGAPQVGYNLPSLFLEQEWHGGGWDAIGLGFAGVPALPIGHGPDYAWTTTSGQTDMLDVYTVVLDPAASASWFQGTWLPVDTRTETVVVHPAPPVGLAGGSLPTLPPETVPGQCPPTCVITRVVHPDPYHEPFGRGRVLMPLFATGPSVQCPDGSSRTTCHLGYVKRRAWYGREAGTVNGFLNFERLDTLAAQQGRSKLETFAALTGDIVSSHNLVYADDAGHIGYWLGGSYPLRPPGTLGQLPLNGDGSEEWGDGIRMYLPFSQQPRAVDPAQGWVASWNNKPSNAAQFAAFDTGDDTKWGLQHHVEAIEDYLSATGRLDINGVARAGYRAAFNDTRVKWVMPILLAGLSDPAAASRCGPCPMSGRFGEAIAALRSWYDNDDPVSGGAERAWYRSTPSPWYDEKQRWTYDSGGQALWDAWWNVAMERAFSRWFDRRLTDYPGPSGDSMENGMDSFLIHALMGPEGATAEKTLPPRVDYLSPTGSFPATPQAFHAEVVSWAAQTMNDTLAWLAARRSGRPAYVGSSVVLPDSACCPAASPISSWREDMRANGDQDMNCFGSTTVYQAPCMPWEDKGTYAQVVEIQRAATGAGAEGSGPPPVMAIPNTAQGSTRVLLAAPLALLLAGWLTGRRRRLR